ncbi:3-oxoacyl-[acyl-carrier-protein] reductase FabG-like [Lytechinus pictus]|uniref:3-oxoacyl-[acyl-carrier-protein] reductase FabG-like n=1 Tax=Lytechinus pictus TaxID=7653 RepID=UPI0030B9BFEC
MNVNLQGKTAVVVGVEGGLGKAVAVHFASHGCSVAVLGKNQEKFDEITRECIRHGLDSKQVLAVECNLQVDSDVENALSQVSDKLGPLHILVNCAVEISYGRLSELAPSAVIDAMQVNTMTTAMATKAAVSYLEKTEGVVINISCSCAHRMSPSLIAFGMAVSSINYFTQSTALELAPKGVRVNAVSPSFNVFESLLEPPPNEIYEEPRQAPLNHPPPTIDDVLKTISFLVSDESRFITGEIICVDNGLHTAKLPI